MSGFRAEPGEIYEQESCGGTTLVLCVAGGQANLSRQEATFVVLSDTAFPEWEVGRRVRPAVATGDWRRLP